jgi:hypothetical protein
MLWLVHKVLTILKYYTGGAASAPILLAKWVGCNAVDVRNQINKIIVEIVTIIAESTDIK